MSRLALPLSLTLAACGCPTFEDLPVTNPTGVGTDEEVTIVRAAIDEFAAWTAREGVCVDAVEIIEEIDWRPEPTAGLYQFDPVLAHVWIETGGAAMRRRTLHEFCHALDSDEGITAARGGLFPPAEGLDPALYDSDDKRAREAFADACEDGPRDHGLARAFEAACGVPTLDPVDRFLADEVYLGHTDSPVALDAFSAIEGDPVEVVLPPDAFFYAVVGDADGLLILTVTWRYLGGWPLIAYGTVHRVALPSGAIVGSWRVPFTGVEDLWGSLAPHDGGPPVVRVTDEHRVSEAYALDEATGTFTRLPLEAPADAGFVVSKGVLWYLSEVEDGTFSLRGVTVADGTPVAGPPSSERFSLGSATPAGDALYGWTLDDVGFLDLATGAFSPLERPGGGTLVGWLDDTRLLFRVEDGTADHAARPAGYAIHDREAGTWALSADPCRYGGPSITVPAAGGLWVLRRPDSDGPNTLVLRPLQLGG